MDLPQASAYSKQYRALSLLLNDSSDTTEYLLLGLLPHHASIEDHDIGSIQILLNRIAGRGKHTGNTLRLMEVHLTAPSFDVNARLHDSR